MWITSPPKADMCSATSDVCFGPKADITSFIRMQIEVLLGPALLKLFMARELR
jgi:hypothetical protein